MKKLSFILVAIILVASIVLLLRTSALVSRQIIGSPAPAIDIDQTRLLRNLSQALRFRTLTPTPNQNDNAGEFHRLHEFLRENFPRTHKQLEQESFAGHSKLYRWAGSDPEARAILFTAHMDVVPVSADSEPKWTHPPFSGAVNDGYVWGRGAMDDKASMMALLETVEALISQGFVPRQTLYLAFGHDEETGGHAGAAKIAAALRERGVKLDFVLDEGGNITDGIISGVDRPVALIGIAEKGYLSLELSVESPGGHSSTPPDRSAIGRLSGAIQRLEQEPFPIRLAAPMQDFFAYLGPELGWFQRLAIANPWLFEPLITRELAKSHLSAALVRTTQAATIFHAGNKENVLPTDARAVINLRILHGESVASVVARVRKIVGDPRVKITALPLQLPPSPIAPSDSEAFAAIQRVIAQVAPGTIVAPALLVAATDARHYASLTDNVYRFLPITLQTDDARRYHGTDERVAVADYVRLVKFYRLLIQQTAGAATNR